MTINRRQFLVGLGAALAAPSVALGAFPGSHRALLTPSFCPEAKALFSRFSTPPTLARRVLINNLIVSLISCGVWAKLDALYLMAAANAQAAQCNWVQNRYNLTPINSPAFTVDGGYQGNGTSSYLDTGFNGTTAASPKYTVDSAHVSGWDGTSRGSVSATLVGARESTTKYIDIVPNFTSNYIARINGNSSGITQANTGTVGLFIVNRSASNAIQGYKNGAALGTSSNASSGIPNANVTLLARSLSGGATDSFTSDIIRMASIGSSLSATDAANLYTITLAYMQAVGAA